KTKMSKKRKPKSNLQKNWVNRREIIRFAEYMAAGGAQFWSGYIGFAILDKILGVTFWPAKILAYFIGATVNFFLERYWVFAQKKTSKKDVEKSAEKFYLLMFINFVLDLAIVGGLREMGISPYIGQFVSAGFFTVFNYLFFKIWVFAKKKKPRKKR
ncbi:MAG: GtrA family protein, partial [Patescibacteria group bacterium]